MIITSYYDKQELLSSTIIYNNNNDFSLKIVCESFETPTLLYNREYWMIYRGPGFLVAVWLGSSPTASRRQQVVSLSQSPCVSPVELTDGRGGGVWGAKS